MVQRLVLLVLGLLGGALPAAADELPLHTIRLPPGFTITLYATDVPGARSLARAPDGTLFIGTRGQGVVYAVRDTDGDARADRRWVIAHDLHMPNGVAFRDGALYVAEVSRILRYDGILARLDAPPPPAVVVADLPTKTHHGWKFIAFGPDGRLYVPIGAPCNVCEEDGYALILSMKPDGSDRRVVARGVRNTVGFDWHPLTRELWFTDNGRDWLGDDLPPCELNRLTQPGAHFGFPYCHGRDIADPEFGKGRRCADYVPPALELGPHVAPLGMRFYTGTLFPERYRGQIFIAEHGSWNRSRKIGYRVTLAREEGGRLVYETFAEGWLQGEEAWGRPVDVLVMPDGALLVSDDRAGVVYRIAYRAPAPAAAH
ncbi:MAG TPA: PQQ-dependent sugar dehydrogenase [Gammaproteobacteria bacterium]|nr:PQQ-dependent sugar dehydrogenase [Gammaproteobacteria bacterium]